MGAIAGYVSDKVSKKDIKLMTDRVSYRGPKKEEFYVSKSVALGYRKLNNDLFENDDVAIVMSGNIYNDDELNKELKVNTKNNTELLYYLYKKFNHKLTSKIKGIFSFCIYDKKKEELFLAVDKWGNKPLYYYKNDNVFLFGSETKCFLDHPLFNKELNSELLSAYLCFNSVPTKETFLKGVYRLLPGEQLIYKNGKVESDIYFELCFEENNSDKDKVVNEIISSMESSVKLQKLYDKNVGSFLSSGVDSSYIVSLIKPKYTFTIGYKEEKYSEEKYAKDLSKILKIENKVKKISKEEYLKEFSHIQYIMDEPLANPSAVAIYFGAKEASKYVDVITSGEGADELFGGYFNYREDVDNSWYLKIPLCIRKLFALVGSIAPEKRGFNFIYRKGVPLEKYNIGLGRVFQDKEALSILKDKNQIKNEDITKSYYEKYKNNTDMVKRQVIDYYFWLVRDYLHCVDRNASAFGMEARTPFLNEDVYKCASKITNELKINSETTKYTLRLAASTVIPNEAYRKKKLGFPVPLREWIREDSFYNEIKKIFLSDTASKFFDQNKIVKLLDKHRNKKEDTYKKVWCIYTFLVWYKEYFEK